MDSPLPKRLKEARLAAKISQKKLVLAAGMDEFSREKMRDAAKGFNLKEPGK